MAYRARRLKSPTTACPACDTPFEPDTTGGQAAHLDEVKAVRLKPS